MHLGAAERVHSHAHRNLRTLENYSTAANASYNDILDHENEEVVGVYRNDGEAADILISTLGLYFLEDEVRFVGFEQVVEVTIDHESEKQQLKKIFLHLSGGIIQHFLVTGGTATTRDAWSFYTFLLRVLRIYS